MAHTRLTKEQQLTKTILTLDKKKSDQEIRKLLDANARDLKLNLNATSLSKKSRLIQQDDPDYGSKSVYHGFGALHAAIACFNFAATSWCLENAKLDPLVLSHTDHYKVDRKTALMIAVEYQDFSFHPSFKGEPLLLAEDKNLEKKSSSPCALPLASQSSSKSESACPPITPSLLEKVASPPVIEAEKQAEQRNCLRLLLDYISLIEDGKKAFPKEYETALLNAAKIAWRVGNIYYLSWFFKKNQETDELLKKLLVCPNVIHPVSDNNTYEDFFKSNHPVQQHMVNFFLQLYPDGQVNYFTSKSWLLHLTCWVGAEVNVRSILKFKDRLNLKVNDLNKANLTPLARTFQFYIDEINRVTADKKLDEKEKTEQIKKIKKTTKTIFDLLIQNGASLDNSTLCVVIDGNKEDLFKEYKNSFDLNLIKQKFIVLRNSEVVPTDALYYAADNNKLLSVNFLLDQKEFIESLWDASRSFPIALNAIVRKGLEYLHKFLMNSGNKIFLNDPKKSISALIEFVQKKDEMSESLDAENVILYLEGLKILLVNKGKPIDQLLEYNAQLQNAVNSLPDNHRNKLALLYQNLKSALKIDLQEEKKRHQAELERQEKLKAFVDLASASQEGLPSSTTALVYPQLSSHPNVQSKLNSSQDNPISAMNPAMTPAMNPAMNSAMTPAMTPAMNYPNLMNLSTAHSSVVTTPMYQPVTDLQAPAATLLPAVDSKTLPTLQIATADKTPAASQLSLSQTHLNIHQTSETTQHTQNVTAPSIPQMYEPLVDNKAAELPPAQSVVLSSQIDSSLPAAAKGTNLFSLTTTNRSLHLNSTAVATAQQKTVENEGEPGVSDSKTTTLQFFSSGASVLQFSPSKNPLLSSDTEIMKILRNILLTTEIAHASYDIFNADDAKQDVETKKFKILIQKFIMKNLVELRSQNKFLYVKIMREYSDALENSQNSPDIIQYLNDMKFLLLATLPVEGQYDLFDGIKKLMMVENSNLNLDKEIQNLQNRILIKINEFASDYHEIVGTIFKEYGERLIQSRLLLQPVVSLSSLTATNSCAKMI